MRQVSIRQSGPTIRSEAGAKQLGPEFPRQFHQELINGEPVHRQIP
jgi:hypothetical protein